MNTTRCDTDNDVTKDNGQHKKKHRKHLESNGLKGHNESEMTEERVRH
jgi:hypothetical protein